MSFYFKPYEGDRPFFFVSYSHRMSEEAVSTVRIIHEKGYRLWYDEGIPAGSDWPANIAQHMLKCDRVLFFISEGALQSPNCLSEMRTAHRLGKPVLAVRLDESVPDSRWAGILEGVTEIPVLNTPTERASAILSSGFITRNLRRRWSESSFFRTAGLVASVLFFFAAASALLAIVSGWWTPLFEMLNGRNDSDAYVPQEVEIVDLGSSEKYFAVMFPDTQQERAVRRALSMDSGEITRGLLSGISELYFCGHMVTDSLDTVQFDSDGTCLVNGAAVIEGKVSDLSLLKYEVRLERLALVCQPVTDISYVSGLLLLRELSIAGCKIEDLSDLEDLPNLEVLHIEHTGIRDLGSLDRFENLRTVTVSREMLPLTWDRNVSFTVILVG